jgi:tetratricopeptide (TPR) repeat protein
MTMKLTLLTTTALLTATSLGTVVRAENIAHTQQLLSTKDCQQCDLRGAGLALSDLAGAQLSGTDLTRANLSRANLTGADLSGANLSGTSLNGAILTGANLSGANLHGTDLRDAYLVDAKLYGTTLSSAHVRGAIGIPQYAGTPEDFYAWGVKEAERGNHNGAVTHYNQTLSLKPDFAPALLGRGVSLYQLGKYEQAEADAQKASELFAEQENQAGYQTSQNLLQAIAVMQAPPEDVEEGGSSFVRFLGTVSSLLLRFLF